MPDWTTILKEVIPSPCYDQRPFVCDGFPDTCEVIVIGENPATKTNIDWWTWWKDDTGFDYKSFMESYNSERDKPSSTRRRLDRIRSKGINCVETNAYSNEQSGGVSQSIENYAVLDVLMKNMPLLKGIIAHGKKAQQSLENFEVPADILTFKLEHFIRECRHIHRHSRESGNPKAIGSKCVFASYRIPGSRFRGDDGNRRLETDILKLTTLHRVSYATIDRVCEEILAA